MRCSGLYLDLTGGCGHGRRSSLLGPRRGNTAALAKGAPDVGAPRQQCREPTSRCEPDRVEKPDRHEEVSEQPMQPQRLRQTDEASPNRNGRRTRRPDRPRSRAADARSRSRDPPGNPCCRWPDRPGAGGPEKPSRSKGRSRRVREAPARSPSAPRRTSGMVPDDDPAGRGRCPSSMIRMGTAPRSATRDRLCPQNESRRQRPPGVARGATKTYAPVWRSANCPGSTATTGMSDGMAIVCEAADLPFLY